MNLRPASLALLCAFAAPAALAAPQLPSARYALAPPASLELPGADRAKLLAEDAAHGRVAAQRYAIPREVDVRAEGQAKAGLGRWEKTPDGREVWRVAVHAPGALSLDFGFERMFLPRGAELYVATPDSSVVLGPYTDADNTRFGGFWTPIVPGENAVIEVLVPAELKRALVLDLSTVHHGYRDIFAGELAAKSLNCEIDVACPEADPFRNQVRAVARYTTQGFGCTGQVLNDTSADNRRFFHTANHCVSTGAGAQGMVLYWKYQSPVCRASGSVENGTPLSVATAISQTGGATLRANHPGSDATLVEINTPIPVAAQVYYDGWDRRDAQPASTAVIHHADTDEKRISLDFNAPVVRTAPTTIDTINYEASASMDVTYERGTTEGGSSGGGLLSNDGRIIGQLGGGPPGSCTTGITDVYGRLFRSWEGGGAASNRFRDWLDAAGSGAQFVDGKEACTAPQIVLGGATTGSAGTPLNFTVTAAGSGPFRVDWDIDNDGNTDRSTAGVATTTSIDVNYPTATSTNVVARVTDSTGCTGEASRAINVGAPDIVATFSAARQVCGNGDANIDPGERWQVPVSLFNSGGAALSGGYAIYSKPPGGTGTTSFGPDAFGYAGSDDASGCSFNFVDLEGVSNALPLTPASAQFPATDDGRATDPIAVAPFNYYGSTVSSLVMSTNGYLSTSAADTGGDYDGDCGPAALNNGGAGGHLKPLHDDLEVRNVANAGLRTRTYATCPRRAESATGDVACTVFQWSHLGQHRSSGPLGDFDVEAIVYPSTGQIVYQYRRAPEDQGALAVIGIQNAAANTTLQYACGDRVVRNGRAVCLFHPNARPLARDPGVRIENPADLVGNLNSGQTATGNINFALRTDAACGAPIQLNYVGTFDANAYSVRAGTALSATVGGGGSCPVANNCAAQITPIALGDGLYANPKRFGNGEGMFTIPSGNQQIVFGAWFTGERNREPAWLIIQGPLADNQAIAPVFRFKQNPGPVFGVSSTQVGTAQVTVLNPNSYVLSFNVDGAVGGQIETVLYPGARGTPNRTGAWYYAAESGWGQVLDVHRSGGAGEEVAINYIYDADGNPVWTLGATGSLDSGSLNLSTFRVHCPNCANFPDFGAFPLSAGTLSRSYSGVTQGTLSTQMTLPGPLSGSWIRSSVPIQMLSVPGPQ